MPQLENGYTRIANKILETLAITNLNGTQRRILDIVFRQTYGYQRKEHELSISFIARATNIHKMQIQRELTSLVKRKIIIVVTEATFNKSRIIKFNKNHNEWLNSEQLAKKLTVSENDNHTVSGLAKSTVSELANQKKKDKENIKKSATDSFSKNASTEKPSDKTEENSIEVFFEEIWNLYPNKRGKGKISASKKKELYKSGNEIKRCIDRYIQDVEAKRNSFPDLKFQHGSTFLNSGYVDFLDENYLEDVKAKLKEIKPAKIIEYGSYDEAYAAWAKRRGLEG